MEIVLHGDIFLFLINESISHLNQKTLIGLLFNPTLYGQLFWRLITKTLDFVTVTASMILTTSDVFFFLSNANLPTFAAS